ncbi:TPA: hypothetical protein ACH3X1_007733 [Trebouxia sp. C0004]
MLAQARDVESCKLCFQPALPLSKQCLRYKGGRCRPFRIRYSVSPEACASGSQTDLFAKLGQVCTEMNQAPPSVRKEYSVDIKNAMEALSKDGATPKWGCGLAQLERRNVFIGELSRVGIKKPDLIGKPSVRNDAAFLTTLVGVTSVIAVAAGSLPGDWGFFVPYLTGAIVLVVLAVGSTAPGLLAFVIGRFAQVFPDYRERVLRHEAAHFLAGYLMRVPVTGYSLDIGKAHTDFAEAKLQQRLVERKLSDEEINQLAVVAMAGATAEAMNYDQVQGQVADLTDLQRILQRSEQKLSNAQQQNMTRWAVYSAATMLTKYKKEYQALQTAMQQRASIDKCVAAIEQT